MEEVDKAWLAAAIDGEGYLKLIKHKTAFIGMLSIEVWNLDFMQKCSRLTNYQLMKHRYMFPNGSTIELERLQIRGKRLVPILKEILPYLIIKKENAKRIIEYHGIDRRGRRRIQSDGSIQDENLLHITVRSSENMKEYMRQYRILRREKIRETRRRYQSLHRERIRHLNALSYRRRKLRNITSPSDVSLSVSSAPLVM